MVDFGIKTKLGGGVVVMSGGVVMMGGGWDLWIVLGSCGLCLVLLGCVAWVCGCDGWWRILGLKM